MRDYAALERGDLAAEQRHKLTRELLGNIIALAWQEAQGIAPGSTGGVDIFELVMRAAPTSLSSLPKEVREILEYQSLPTGALVELTDMVVGAQAAGSIGRLNPQNLAPVHKTHPIEARFVLDLYSEPFPAVVNWVRQRVKAVGAEYAGQNI